MEAALGKGRESKKSNYMEHPMVKGDSPPIQRIDEGRIYSRFSTMDGGLRLKCMVSKYPCPKYHAILYLRMAYIVSTLYTTLLQLLYGKRLAIC